MWFGCCCICIYSFLFLLLNRSIGCRLQKEIGIIVDKAILTCQSQLLSGFFLHFPPRPSLLHRGGYKNLTDCLAVSAFIQLSIHSHRSPLINLFPAETGSPPAAVAQLTNFHFLDFGQKFCPKLDHQRRGEADDVLINASIFIHPQVHAAEQEQRIPEDLLGVVSRV